MRRVVTGPVDIAGVATGLGEGFHALGWPAAVLDLDGSPFGTSRRADAFNPWWARWLNATARRTRKAAASPPGRILHRIFRFTAGVLALASTVFRRTDFVFLFGRSFLPWNADLLLLRMLGKRTFMIFCGSDSRPCYLNYGWLEQQRMRAGTFPVEAVRSRNATQVRALRRISRRTHCVDHPLSAHLQPKRFVNWLWVGLPTPCGPQEALPAGKLRVLHAPSNPTLKGSDFIRSTVEALQSEGLDFDYEEVVNRPNAEVQAAIRRSHIIVDEMYSDIGLAGLGCEAAAQGRVVVVGGYGWEHLRKCSPPGLDFPSVRVTLETLRDELRRLMLMPRADLQSLADAHYQFIKQEWAAASVARRYAAALDGTAPPEAWFDPREIAYPWGVGGTPEKVREAVEATAGQLGAGFLVPAARAILARNAA